MNVKRTHYKGDIAVYKGEEELCMGTIEECAAELGVKRETITFYMTPTYKNRLSKRNNKNSREVVTLD